MRLRRSWEVRAVLDRGVRRAAGPVVLYWRRRAGGGGPRVAVVAPRSVGKAVRRNRAKRLLREAVRRLLDRLPGDVDLVWIARPGLAEARGRDVEAWVERLLRREGLLDGGGGSAEPQDQPRG